MSKTNQKTKAANDESAAFGRAERRRVERAKAKVAAYERKNRSRLVVWRSTNGWWKMGGNSALIYVYRIFQRFGGGKRPRLKPDSDFYSKFETGVVAFKDIDALIKKLESIKIFIYYRDEDVISFDLGYTMTEAEIEKLKNIESDRTEQVNMMVMPEVTHPKLYTKMKWLHHEMYTIVHGMTAVHREMAGIRLTELTRQMLGTYYDMTNAYITETEALEQIARGAQRLNYYLKELMEVDLMDTHRALKLAKEIVEVKQIAERAKERAERADAKAKKAAADGEVAAGKEAAAAEQ